MDHGLALTAAVIGAAVSVISLLYTAGAAAALAVWSRRTVPPPGRLLPVTVLKPVCGDEPLLYENLRSFCDQDYPAYQVIFGARSADDPALAVIRRLIAEFPRHDIHLVVNPRLIGSNFKVSNLSNIYEAARHPWLVLADSDIRVGRDYLRGVVGPLNDPTVGVVTCLYRGRPHGGLWSRLGALFINEGFLPSVLVARALGSQSFGFGSTLALRREVLEAIGGFAALGSQLADDYMLAELARRRGLRTVLSPYLVETLVYEPRAADLLRHELRWARTIRTVQPWGYAGSWVTYVIPASLLGAALIHRAPWAWTLPLLALALRLVLHYSARKGLQLTHFTTVWLVPLRDVLSFAIWSGSFLSRRVTWRQRALSVQANGRIQMDKELLP